MDYAPFVWATRRGPRAWVRASIRKAFRLTFRRFAAARTRRWSATGSLPTIWMRPFISFLQVWGRAGCSLTHDRSRAATSPVESAGGAHAGDEGAKPRVTRACGPRADAGGVGGGTNRARRRVTPTFACEASAAR